MNDSWHGVSWSHYRLKPGKASKLPSEEWLTFLWTFSFLKISVASSKWFFSKILSPCQRENPPVVYSGSTYFFPFHAKRGRLRISATQYPLMRNRKVRKA